MTAIIGAVAIMAAAVPAVLAACGLPVGAFIMGGRHTVLPKSMRAAAVFSALLLAFAAVILLQTGHILPRMLSAPATKIVCIVFAVYLSLNTGMNLLSKSEKEKFVMTPLALIAAVCFWAAALNA